ncbi:hypothetical protein [Planctobacterium marinum]|uniref:Uncharacterized protein n=1 Tax=Planctobacterium marinum TaxID=1631968 RepID=A0AA48I5P4_9ALTE|nr:hypothetical protein MACH26_19110 [Planctobacterium marinum]
MFKKRVLTALILMLWWLFWLGMSVSEPQKQDVEPIVEPALEETSPLAGAKFIEFTLPPPPPKVTTAMHDSVSNNADNTQAEKTLTTPFPFNGKINASQVYEQLSNDRTVQVQLRLPDSDNDKAILFDWLYQCAGVQFGIWHNDQVTQISPKRYVPVSDWMRIANHYLSPQEQQWWHESPEPGQPVRLFPMSMDKTLANDIAQHLKGHKLLSFSAQYQLSSAGLFAQHIVLNGMNISGRWKLANKRC